jgi:rhodanese-related sulfurtransferase
MRSPQGSAKRLHVILAVLVASAITIAGCSSSTAATIETVSPSAAAEAIDSNADAIVLDIRTPEEFEEGIIEGAVNIDFYEPNFADQLDGLDKSADYVVYCRSGNRSGQAMPTFRELGFTSVIEIDGGITGWYQEGLPVLLP